MVNGTVLSVQLGYFLITYAIKGTHTSLRFAIARLDMFQVAEPLNLLWCKVRLWKTTS